MTTERRYNEQEITAIFKQAATDQEAVQQRLHSDGLTLAELKQIGKEAGITPEFIARAAATIDRTDAALPPTTYFGFPVTVARTVDLPGPLSDEAWDQLVVALRETFQASGEVRREGLLRQWRNGNLHALVEPTESGHRLRLRTMNANARTALLGGFAFFAVNLVIILMMATVATGKPGINPDTLYLALLSAMGLGSMGFAAYRLPRWAKERKGQMETIATRAVELAMARPAAVLPVPASSGPLGLETLESQEEIAQAQTQPRTRT